MQLIIVGKDRVGISCMLFTQQTGVQPSSEEFCKLRYNCPHMEERRAEATSAKPMFLRLDRAVEVQGCFLEVI